MQILIYKGFIGYVNILLNSIRQAVFYPLGVPIKSYNLVISKVVAFIMFMFKIRTLLVQKNFYRSAYKKLDNVNIVLNREVSGTVTAHTTRRLINVIKVFLLFKWLLHVDEGSIN